MNFSLSIPIMISTYGYCSDIPHTGIIDDKFSSDKQHSLYFEAAEFVQKVKDIFKPGISFTETSHACPVTPEKYQAQKHFVITHDIGLCDEYPLVPHPEDIEKHRTSTIITPGITICAEVYSGEVNINIDVKLKQRILITDNGSEKISSSPP